MDINFHQRLLDNVDRFWDFYGNHGDFLTTFINRFQWHEYSKHFFVSDFPLHVDIETSSKCNMSCPMCFRRNFNDLGEMEWKTFTRIVDECEENGLYSIRLSWRGETMTHPKVFDMIDYSVKRIPNVSFLTNTFYITNKVADFLIEKGLTYLGCSFDGIGDVYNKVRAPAEFEDSMDKLRYLKKKRDRLDLDNPQIRICSIWPAVSKNPKEFYECMKSVSDMVVVNNYKDFAEKPNPVPGFICQYPWERLIIAHDGRAQCCTGWNADDITLGNIKTYTLRKMWHGEILNRLRELHKKGNRMQLRSCSTCRHGNTLPDQSIDIEDIVSRKH